MLPCLEVILLCKPIKTALPFSNMAPGFKAVRSVPAGYFPPHEFHFQGIQDLDRDFILEIKQVFQLSIIALGRLFEAVVDEIVPSADPGSRTFLVKVRLASSSGLFPGMFGRLLIPIGQTKKIYIPQKAVTHVGQLNFVMVRTNQGPVRRYVRLGSRTPDDHVEIISGLSQGEQILTSPE